MQSSIKKHPPSKISHQQSRKKKPPSCKPDSVPTHTGKPAHIGSYHLSCRTVTGTIQLPTLPGDTGEPDHQASNPIEPGYTWHFNP